MYNGLGSQETRKFEKYPDNPKGKWDELAKKGIEVLFILYNSIQS